MFLLTFFVTIGLFIVNYLNVIKYCKDKFVIKNFHNRSKINVDLIKNDIINEINNEKLKEQYEKLKL